MQNIDNFSINKKIIMPMRAEHWMFVCIELLIYSISNVTICNVTINGSILSWIVLNIAIIFNII